MQTFLTIIAANHTFDVYLTATPPTQLRFRVLNADPSFKAVITMYYFTSQRIDLYMNGVFINATNANYKDGQMTILDPSGNLSTFMPTVNSPAGSNLYYKGDKKMHFTIDGSSYFDLQIAPVLYVRFGFPAITPEQFFNTATIVGNMALLLGISSSQIRYVNIIRQTAGKKKRQSSDIILIEVQICSNPVTSLNDTSQMKAIQSQMNNLTTTVQNQYASGQLQAKAASVLNVTMASMGIIPPNVTAPGTDTIQNIVSIANIKVLQNAAQCRALVPCYVQPILQVIGSDVSRINIRRSFLIYYIIHSFFINNKRAT